MIPSKEACIGSKMPHIHDLKSFWLYDAARQVIHLPILELQAGAAQWSAGAPEGRHSQATGEKCRKRNPQLGPRHVAARDHNGVDIQDFCLDHCVGALLHGSAAPSLAIGCPRRHRIAEIVAIVFAADPRVLATMHLLALGPSGRIVFLKGAIVHSPLIWVCRSDNSTRAIIPLLLRPPLLRPLHAIPRFTGTVVVLTAPHLLCGRPSRLPCVITSVAIELMRRCGAASASPVR